MTTKTCSVAESLVGTSCSIQSKTDLSVTSECSKKICCGQISQLAYQKWEEAGSPISDGVEYWLEAEQELQNCE